MNDSAGDGAYSAILKDRLSRFSIKNLNGDGESSVNPKLGTFFNKNDSRIQLANVKSYFGPKQNVSFSFNPSSFICNNCTANPAHHILSGVSKDCCSVFVLSDQCFPPAVPALGAGDCINIIRIENGSVNELARLFVDVFAGAQIRVGSLILLNSVSHLAVVGTAAYAESLVRAAKYLMTSFGGKVSVKLGVPVLLEGTRDSLVSGPLAARSGRLG
jgi:hypothetical protein